MRPQALFPLFAPVASLKGVGPRVAPLLEKVAGPVVRDLIFLPPQSLIHRRRATIADAQPGELVILEVTVEAHTRPRGPRQPWKIRIADATGWASLVFFKVYGTHLEERHPPGSRRLVSGRVEADSYGAGVQIAHPDHLVELEKGAEIALTEPVYPATAGLPARTVGRIAREALARAPELSEWQDPAFLAAQGWPAWRSALQALHNPVSDSDVGEAAPHRRRLAYDELLAHQLALVRRKRANRRAAGPHIPPSQAAKIAEAALPFRLTGAQSRALEEIRVDLGSGERMVRLLQGDVGAGKTAVALLAMIDVASAGRQAALMAPTEILARQHFETLEAPLRAAGIEPVLLMGRHKGAARAQRQRALASGAASVAVGTHALFQDEVVFQDLALAVVDEQHRFGVSERSRLMAKGPATHLLAMSATPIPRTLELTLFGDMDVSRLDEKPPGRTPVATRAAPTPRIGEVVERLRAAVAGGAQAFWICPLVAESEQADLAAAEARRTSLEKVFGNRVGLAHGKLSAAEKDEAMSRFAAGELSVLVATTVVEVGVDVPAASIMVIEQAERFGLAQLHQLRGRVGRGAAVSSCVLLYDPPLSEAAQRRLDVLRRSDDGFEIAEIDLQLRGGGDPLGLAQSGFPAYRLADPIAHRDLVLAAADDARLIMARDPELATPRGEALKTLSALFDWRDDGSHVRAG
ncbi:MAG TPA: ATP-dependent DNA helicase RecG [Caulobacteraceae bacterium]|nr:ATP-dependent DNA helicase RecG [Caulobacteraceae bacterium]